MTYLVVEFGSRLYGPFPNREDAQRWVNTRIVNTMPPGEIAVWSIRPVRECCCDGSSINSETPCPDDCACHAYMPPGRVCSWCQQEGHEDA